MREVSYLKFSLSNFCISSFTTYDSMTTMLQKLIIITTILINITLSAHHKLIASFTDNSSGVIGNVTVDYGTISIDLVLNPTILDDLLPNGYDTCTEDGLKYHIHEFWEHDDMTEVVDMSLCGSAYTGGHYDPWTG